MNTFKIASALLLPTNNKSHIYLDTKVKRLGYVSGKYPEDLEQFSQTDVVTQNQHLYIISSEIVESGNENTWYYDRNFNKVAKWIGESDTYVCNWFSEIILSSDRSLNISVGLEPLTHLEPLSQIAQPFLEEFVCEYNQRQSLYGDVPQIELMLEYEQWSYVNWVNAGNYPNMFKDYILKDNSIKIKPLKESWTRSEILADIEQSMIKGLNLGEYRDHWIR